MYDQMHSHPAARGRAVGRGHWAPTLIIVLVLLISLLITASPASAQSGLCARQVSGVFTLNGVVARGAAMGGGACAPDAIWNGVGPANFSSGDAYLYVAHNTTNNHLYLGIDLKGDRVLSQFDVVMLYFNANNNGAWDAGDFAIRVVLSNAGTPATPAITDVTACSQSPVLPVDYYPHDAAGWTVGSAADRTSITAKVAYDLSAADGDAEDDIWNLEIEMPLFTLNVGSGFGLGALAFVDDGSGGPIPVGSVLQYPGGINTNAGFGISFANDPGFPTEPNNLGALAHVTISNRCFDVSLSNSSAWEINGSPAGAGEYKIYRHGRPTPQPDAGFNTFRINYKYEGPAGAIGSLPNTGQVQLKLMPFTGGVAPGATGDWTKTQTVNIAAYPQEYPVEFKYQFSPMTATNHDPDLTNAARALWTTILSSNSPNDFVCSDTYLQTFKFNDNLSNDTVHLNHNFFATSEYAQDVQFFGSDLPKAALDEKGAATVLLHMETVNEPKRTTTATAPTLGGMAGSVNSTGGEGSPWRGGANLVLVVAAALGVIGAIAWAQRRGKLGRPAAWTSAVAALTLLALLGACVTVPPPTATPQPTVTPQTAPARWQFENGEKAGIREVKGRPGWYEMPLQAKETKTLTMKFAGQPLPYETRVQKLAPARNGRLNSITVPVKSGSVVTVVAFGEVDPDGEKGPLAPTSSTGFIQKEGGRLGGFPLQTGYYEPSQYAGALIGSFDDFKTSFVVGRNISAIVPGEARELRLAVNAPQEAVSAYTGEFEIYTILTAAPATPTHTGDAGDATYNIPPQLPMYQVLVSVSMNTYYAIDDVRDGKVVGKTLHPLGDAHFSIYNSHAD